jgi:hypothetical protein
MIQTPETHVDAAHPEMRRTEPPRTGFGLSEIAWMLLCSVVATTVYALNSGDSPLWLDEFATVNIVRLPFVDSLLQLQDHSSPLYQMLLRLLVHEEYPAESLIRAPAVIFAGFSLIATWWLARSLFGPWVAAVTIGLLAINPGFTRYAIEGRPYSMFVLFSVLSMGTFYRLVHRGGHLNLLAYVASTGLLVYSHPYSFFVFPAQAAYVLANTLINRHCRQFLGLMAVAFGALTVIAAPAIWLLSRCLRAGVRTPNDLSKWKERLLDMDFFSLAGSLVADPILGALCGVVLLSSLWLGRSPFDEYAPSSGVSNSRALRHWLVRRNPALLCVLWVASSLLLLKIVVSIVGNVFYFRYALPVTAPLLILSVAMLRRFKLSVQVVTLALLLTLIVPKTIISLCGVYGHPHLIKFLHQINDDQSPVFVHDAVWDTYALRYYGLPEDQFQALPLGYLRDPTIPEVSHLPSDRRFFLVDWNSSRNKVASFFQNHPRAYRIHDFDTVCLFEVEKVGTPARWLRSQDR